MRGKGSKLGEPCTKVRLSLDRLPIEKFAHIFFFSLSLSLSGLLRANVLCSNVASRKCYSTLLKGTCNERFGEDGKIQ